ncbi:MAG: hypothetical protein ACP5DZ_04165 [Bacteroidales bacterium]
MSTKELIEDKGVLMTRQLLENRLIFGSYPDIINNVGDAKELLYNITDSYLFKDILSMENIHKPTLL